MRVLLAGVGGFIGSHLAEELLNRDYEVIGLDNFVTGRNVNTRSFADRKNFKLVKCDVTLPIERKDSLNCKFDYVLNFASPASPTDFGSLALEILKVGSRGTENLLQRAEEDGAIFFQASTSEVYGDPLVHPQTESYLGNVSSTGPRSCYDESKRFSEALVTAYRRNKNVDVRIARIFNTYGERMKPNDGRVVSTMIRQALQNEPLTIFGDGEQTRSFCYIADEVQGLVALMHSNYQDPVNIGNPIEHSMNDLAKVIIELAKSSSGIVKLEMPFERDGDPKQRCPDISLAREILQWEPVIGLEEGLKRTIEHYRRDEGLILV